MNDEVKRAIESLQREMADGDPDWWKRELLVFAYITEVRTAAAALIAAWEVDEIGQVDGELIEQLKKVVGV